MAGDRETGNVPLMNRFGQPIGAPVPGWAPPPFPEKRSMVGNYVRLEPFDAKTHGPDLFDAFSKDGDGKNWTYLPYGPFATYNEFAQWAEPLSRNRDPQFYTVVHPVSERPVGMASYLRIKPDSGSIEVGHIHFSPLLQRSPAATETMYLMMRRAFELGYRRYEWKCDALNAASCSAAQRLGLSFEGVFRKALVYKGRNRDTAWFAAVDSDWTALKEAFERWLEPSNFDDSGNQKASLREWTDPLLKKRAPF